MKKDCCWDFFRDYFRFIKKSNDYFTGYLCPGPEPFKNSLYHQAALIEYSNIVKEIFDFNDKSNTAQIQKGIRSMPYLRSSTCTDKAFKYAREKMFRTSKGKHFVYLFLFIFLSNSWNGIRLSRLLGPWNIWKLWQKRI